MTTAFETTVQRLKPTQSKMFAEGKVGARLVSYANGVDAVMKVAHKATTKGQRSKQAGIDTATLPMREVAFYRLSDALGFDVVPETVLGKFKGVPTSFQQYLTSSKLYDVEPRLRDTDNKEQWIIALRETLRDKVPLEDTIKLTVLDFLACQRDRHAANYGVRVDIDGGKARFRLAGWDNGCAFGLTQERYHCVAHKYLFRYAFDLSSVWKTLTKLRRSTIVSALKGLLSDEAIDHVWMRVQFMITFPHRMPWVTLSSGNDDPDAFPTYAEFFAPLLKPNTTLVLQTQA